MIKFRLYLNKDKETFWLNEMASQGYAMTGFFAGFYIFEKSEPGKYVYQIDFGNKLFAVSEDYREFMNDAGVEIVQTWGYWIILRKRASEGEFQLYTDVDTTIEHYTKIRKMFKIVTIIELIGFFIEVAGVLSGSWVAMMYMLVIGVMIFAIMNAVYRTNCKINELKERKGEMPDNKICKNSKVSPVLLCGLFLNACALILQESMAPMAVHIIQIAAIILMLVGIYRSGKVFRKE